MDVAPFPVTVLMTRDDDSHSEHPSWRPRLLPCPGGADVSLDGTTNPIDAALILQFQSGLIRSLPP